MKGNQMCTEMLLEFIEERITALEKEKKNINPASWGACIQQALCDKRIEELNMIKFKTLAKDFNYYAHD